MMQAAKHRPFHNTEARWQLVSVATGRNALLAGFRQARTKTAGWPASVIGLGPQFPDRPQMVLVQRDELVQACAAQVPAEPLAKRVRRRCPYRRVQNLHAQGLPLRDPGP